MPRLYIEDADSLTPEALVLARRRVRSYRLRVVAVAGLVAAAAFSARPFVHAMKAWQARRLAAEALGLIDRRDWFAARDKAVDAYAISRAEPMALRAVGRLLSRTGGKEATGYYRQLAEAGALTPEDRRDFANSALLAGDVPAAIAQSTWLLEHGPDGAGAPPVDLLLAARIAEAGDRQSAAVDFFTRVLAHPTATESEQFAAAAGLVTFAATCGKPNGPVAALAWERVRHLADGRGPTGLNALILLSHRPPPAAAQPLPPGWMPPAEIARALAAHPLAAVSHQLLALDLSAGADPAARAASVDTAISRWRGSDDEGLSALAAWLLARGEPARVLEVLPAERIGRNATLCVHRLNALAGSGRWAGIRETLSTISCPLDELSRHMYLASALMHLDEPVAAEVEWSRSRDAAAKDADRLCALGRYAESQDALGAAESAYAAAVAAAPRMRAAHLALYRVADAHGQTAAAQRALAAMLLLWPQDDAVIDAEAYHRLLLGANGAEARAIEQTAAALAGRDQGNWEVRATLSLARLRQGESGGAVQAFAGLRAADDPSVPPGALAVRAAAMAAAGWNLEASADARTLAGMSLRPEEYALIAPLLAGQER